MAHRTKICDQGGIFNASRPLAYSAETKEILNVLMKEARLTMTQRKSLMNNLRSGGSSSTTTSATSIIRSEPTTAIKRHRSFKPRTLKDIVESGAYQRESYVPSSKLKNYVVEKEKLQSIMTYGEETKLDHIGKNKKLVAQKRLQDLTEEELIDSTISEIEDREKFLLDMKRLGQGSTNSDRIIHEIRHRIQILGVIISKTTNKYRAADVQKIADKYRNPLGTPKPLPGFIPIM